MADWMVLVMTLAFFILCYKFVKMLFDILS